MAVPNLPFYLSQANTEMHGNGYATTILNNARLGVPNYLSTLAGKSYAHLVSSLPSKIVSYSSSQGANLYFMQSGQDLKYRTHDTNYLVTAKGAPIYVKITHPGDPYSTNTSWVNCSPSVYFLADGAERGIESHWVSRVDFNVKYSSSASDAGVFYDTTIWFDVD